jgi:GTP-binding protein
VVHVPVGTLVYTADERELLCDLVENGQEFIAAKPGKGGRGNARFVNATRQAPMFAEEGRPGQERRLFLNLKCIADIGLVGYPNAGKSTLLNKVSAAHPKTAPYPFTTLHPNVGIVEFSNFSRMSIADIPGLIDGAHENKGLGHNFLKHIERCRVLVYVVDIAATDQREPVDDLKTLMRELDAYQEGLSKRAKIVLANKVDDDVELFDDEIALLREHTDLPVMPISAQTGYNCDEFCQGMRQLLLREKAIEAERNHTSQPS